MKKILIGVFMLLGVSILSSCNYLNVDDYFEDTFKQDSIFANKVNIERYYNGAVALLPKEGRLWHWGCTPGVTGSDEAVSCGKYSNGILEVSFSGTELTIDAITASSMGGWDWNFNVWPDCYKVIRKVNTMLAHLENVPDMNSFERIEFRAKARFLRAYAYYWILQNQGPMILLGDELLDTNEEPSYYKKTRNTYDECVDYICKEFEAAAEGLPEEQPVDLIASPTSGAALALVARLRLQAASPLFNGGDAARKYFGNFTRCTDGVHYVSQVYDERKWAVAAAAAKRVIDMGRYELHTVPADNYTAELPENVPSESFPYGAGGIDPYRSYSEMFTGETLPSTNKELILGNSQFVSDHTEYIFPLGYGGASSISVPQRIVDAFYMVDGRDINNSSAKYPYENSPYDKNCIVQENKILSLNYTLQAGTYKAYANREPRFYANIGFTNTLWTMSSCSEGGKNNIAVQYYKGGNCGKDKSTNNVYNLTGYTSKKFVHPRDARTGTGARIISKTFPIIRYAEILLSYAEALNNLENSYEVDGYTYYRDFQSIKDAFNPVRYRAGLPGITDADLATIDGFNNVIQRERLIEFFHEGRRYYDIRRWGIVEDLENEPLTGCNVEQSEWEGFYASTIIQYSTIRQRVFKPKMIFLPLELNELRKVPTLDQNPGWEK